MKHPEPKPLATYEDQYMIYPDGRVWSVVRESTRFGRKATVGGKFLSVFMVGAGYPAVRLNNPNLSRPIHRMVAHAFVPGRFPGAVVGFKDRVRTNYDYTNLEWITRSEALLRASAHTAHERATATAPKYVTPPRRASGALDVWDKIPGEEFYTSAPLPWETSYGR